MVREGSLRRPALPLCPCGGMESLIRGSGRSSFSGREAGAPPRPARHEEPEEHCRPTEGTLGLRTARLQARACPASC